MRRLLVCALHLVYDHVSIITTSTVVVTAGSDSAAHSVATYIVVVECSAHIDATVI
jgi:hypothetical protein